MSDQIISTFEANRLLDYEFSSTVYIGLHDGDPGSTGANEIAGVDRQAVAAAGWSEAAAKAIHNVDDINFTDMPEVTATHFSAWDSLTGGNYLRGGPLDAELECEAGDTARIPAETAVFTIENKPEE